MTSESLIDIALKELDAAYHSRDLGHAAPHIGKAQDVLYRLKSIEGDAVIREDAGPITDDNRFVTSHETLIDRLCNLADHLFSLDSNSGEAALLNEAIYALGHKRGQSSGNESFDDFHRRIFKRDPSLSLGDDGGYAYHGDSSTAYRVWFALQNTLKRKICWVRVDDEDVEVAGVVIFDVPTIRGV